MSLRGGGPKAADVAILRQFRLERTSLRLPQAFGLRNDDDRKDTSIFEKLTIGYSQTDGFVL